jgi:hypothetical protein
VQPSGKLRPLTYWGGKGLSDVRMISGRFLLSFQSLWERRGDEILDRVADEHPELILLSQIKLANVTRLEVGAPGDFSNLGSKQAIIEKLEERAGPEARKLFQKFVKDMAKLQAQREREIGQPLAAMLRRYTHTNVGSVCNALQYLKSFNPQTQ